MATEKLLLKFKQIHSVPLRNFRTTRRSIFTAYRYLGVVVIFDDCFLLLSFPSNSVCEAEFRLFETHSRTLPTTHVQFGDLPRSPLPSSICPVQIFFPSYPETLVALLILMPKRERPRFSIFLVFFIRVHRLSSSIHRFSFSVQRAYVRGYPRKRVNSILIHTKQLPIFSHTSNSSDSS